MNPQGLTKRKEDKAMKKFLLTISLFLLISKPVFALIETNNVSKDDFLYEVGYAFATGDLAASQSAVQIPVAIETGTGHIFEYTIPRDGRIVGMSVTGDIALTVAGAATFDVTINGNVTGVQTVIEKLSASTGRAAVGIGGSADAQYAYIRQDRADTVVARGLRAEYPKDTASFHDADHRYGKATALVAGNRVGVKVTTTSGFVSMSDYVVVVYVLE